MAIYGIGAIYDDGKWDVSDDFVQANCACIGWSESDAPALFQILRYIKIGDIIYIKTSPRDGTLRVKGVGIVTSNVSREFFNSEGNSLGTGISVRWTWTGYETLGVFDDKYNVRKNTIYEEFNSEVQNQVINFLLNNAV